MTGRRTLGGELTAKMLQTMTPPGNSLLFLLTKTLLKNVAESMRSEALRPHEVRARATRGRRG